MKGKRHLDAFFKPRSVAMIGASSAPGKIGYDVIYNLVHAGFQGVIYPVNPKADQILGLKSYGDVASIPEPPDLAVIVIPSRMVIGTIEECGKRGVKAAIIVTGGFAEAGEDGEKLQAELADTAGKYNVRLIGPNCQGVNNPYSNLCASWPLLTTRGRMAFISQSGTVGAALIDWANVEKLGVSVFVSLGNRADVDESDCVRYFNEDKNTRVIALYVEGVKRPAAFLEALEKATKPVVILKAGRTARGRVAAESHTKSLAGTDEIYEAIFRKYKIHRAENLEELYDFAKALAYLDKPKGRRLLSITSSGGAAILGIDESEKYGFTSPVPSPALQKRLRSFLPAHCGVYNPIDLTGDAITDPSLYAKVIAEAKSDYDTSIVIFGDPVRGASDIVTGKGELVVYCGGAEVEREEASKMHRKGIPVYPTPERGVRALAQLVRFDQAPAGKAPHAPAPAGGPNLLPPLAAMALLKKYRVPVADTVLADTPFKAAAAAKAFGGPVALKIASPEISHKSDAGGIRLNLASGAAVRGAFGDILETVKRRLPKARLDGVTVSAMAPAGGTEVILGVLKDPQYGHALMFGLGGIFTEIYRDVQFCLLPATESEFLQAIRGIRGWPLLAGARGRKPADVKALVKLMTSLARLVQDRPEIEQIDLNPVLVYEKGLLTVDWRIYTGK
jgi:acetyltransferase